jgi:hypothetical protein
MFGLNTQKVTSPDELQKPNIVECRKGGALPTLWNAGRDCVRGPFKPTEGWEGYGDQGP